MPLAKIHVTEGQYDEPRLQKLSAAVQDALRGILRVPADDFFQIIHVLPKNRFLHTPSLNERVVAATRISPDDLMIYLYEIPGENVSFGQGLAQRAFISGGT
jgi:hypothetical protein